MRTFILSDQVSSCNWHHHWFIHLSNSNTLHSFFRQSLLMHFLPKFISASMNFLLGVRIECKCYCIAFILYTSVCGPLRSFLRHFLSGFSPQIYAFNFEHQNKTSTVFWCFTSERLNKLRAKKCRQLSVKFDPYLSCKANFRTFKEKHCVHLFTWNPLISTNSVAVNLFYNVLCFRAVFSLTSFSWVSSLKTLFYLTFFRHSVNVKKVITVIPWATLPEWKIFKRGFFGQRVKQPSMNGPHYSEQNLFLRICHLLWRQ